MILMHGIHGCKEYRLSFLARILPPAINAEFAMECKMTAYPTC